MTSTDASIEPFLAQLASADEAGARSTVEGLLSGHEQLAGILDHLMPAAMKEVGRRWESGSWTVSREHVATHICDDIISELLAKPAPQPVAAGKALVACAEGEWHALPARVAATGLQQAGWEITTLGPSVPASQLGTMIHDMGPDIVAVSCSMPANLPGARRMIVTARETGTPVIVGGRGFGSGPARAQLLGASAWARNVEELVRVAADIDRFSLPAEPIEHPRHTTYEGVGRHQKTITSALERLLIGEVGEVDDASTVAPTAVWILRSLKASLLCDDLSILTDDLKWHQRRADLGLGSPPTAYAQALRDALPTEISAAGEWLERAEAEAWG